MALVDRGLAFHSAVRHGALVVPGDVAAAVRAGRQAADCPGLGVVARKQRRGPALNLYVTEEKIPASAKPPSSVGASASIPISPQLTLMEKSSRSMEMLAPPTRPEQGIAEGLPPAPVSAGESVT